MTYEFHQLIVSAHLPVAGYLLGVAASHGLSMLELMSSGSPELSLLKMKRKNLTKLQKLSCWKKDCSVLQSDVGRRLFLHQLELVLVLCLSALH